MEDARKVIKEVELGCQQKSVSKKDEVTVMKAILNDPSYAVGVYAKEGKIEDYSPSSDLRKMLTNVISTTTKISSKEAAELVNNYEFTKSDASTMVNVSKEFINSYLPTGRKLALGGRENSNIHLLWKMIPERTAGIPNKNSKDRKSTLIPAHGGIKTSNPCPSWIEKNK